MSSTLHDIPGTVLEALALPSFDDLTGAQVRGASCVWCGARLTAETAVALGEHMSAISGSHWFPRACRTDAADRAHAGLFSHAPMCEQCTDDPDGCDVSRWLYRLVRENRR